MNPFDKPPRPAKTKALSRPINPFETGADEDDITIEFQSPPSSSSTNDAALPSRFSPIASNPQNKHRPYAATVQYAQPPPKLPRPQQAPAPAPARAQQPPTRRVFGGIIPISGDNSPHAVQYRAEVLSQRASPNDNPADDTESEPSPSVRSPFRLLIPSRSSYQPANRASPGLTRDDYAESSSSSSSSEDSEEDNSDSEGTDTTAGPSTRSSGSGGLLNDTGIEMQSVTPMKKSKKNVAEKKPKKEKKEKKKKKVRKPRKGPVVCVDEDNENQLIRFLISEKGKLSYVMCVLLVGFCCCPCASPSILNHFMFTFAVYGYPNTHGGRCSNYYYYILYNHPVLSIFCTHKLHPFTKKHRFIVFLCSMAFAVCFAFILLDTPLVPAVSFVVDCI